MATVTSTVSPGTTSSATYNSLPDWYQQYGQALAGAGLGALSQVQNYQGYTNPDGTPAQRVAGLSDQQQQAQGLAGSTVGSWQPWLQGAQQSNQTGMNTLQGAQGTVQGAAQGYQSGDVNPYMNDYTNDVVNQIGVLGNRNLMENVLPQVNSTFTGAGQFGSTRNADFENRAVRDNQQAVSNAQATALMNSENQSMNLWQNDQNRALQAGQTEAGIGSAQGALGNNQASYANQLQTGNINDINSLLTTGGLDQNTQQKSLDAAYQDFLDQRDYSVNALGALSQVLPNVSGKITPNTQSVTVGQAPSATSTQNWTDLINLINGAGN